MASMEANVIVEGYIPAKGSAGRLSKDTIPDWEWFNPRRVGATGESHQKQQGSGA